MDDDNDTDKVLYFADKVIHRFVDNLVGRKIQDNECRGIRLVFRYCGGRWDRIVVGDPIHIGLLMQLVQIWGRMQPEANNA